MNIDYTVTALMFPAIPLLMSVYSNRFHSLSILIRQLHDEHVYEKHIPPEWIKQFINLSGRITLLRWTILFSSFGFLFNMLTVFALYLDEVFLARVIFGSCCLSMIVSIIFFSILFLSEKFKFLLMLLNSICRIWMLMLIRN